MEVLELKNTVTDTKNSWLTSKLEMTEEKISVNMKMNLDIMQFE